MAKKKTPKKTPNKVGKKAAKKQDGGAPEIDPKEAQTPESKPDMGEIPASETSKKPSVDEAGHKDALAKEKPKEATAKTDDNGDKAEEKAAGDTTGGDKGSEDKGLKDKRSKKKSRKKTSSKKTSKKAQPKSGETKDGKTKDDDAESKDGEGETEEEEEEKRPLRQVIVEEIKFFAGLISFLLVFYTFGFGHYKIPSESMQPTLEVGDHLYVSKFAYGYSRESLPFGLSALPVPDGKILSRLPKRGDVVVFRNPRSRVVMIKRVIGLPGDEIVVSRGRFYLNGEIIDRKQTGEYTYRADFGPRTIPQIVTFRNKDHTRFGHKITVREYEEQWPDEDKPHLIYEMSDMANLDNIRPMIVPAGTVFFMGDNRDRSLDSRAIDGPGFVPVDHLIGRADRMMFSFKKCPDEEGIFCPKRGFMSGL